jgi:hypothetical protein
LPFPVRFFTRSFTKYFCRIVFILAFVLFENVLYTSVVYPDGKCKPLPNILNAALQGFFTLSRPDNPVV